MPVEEDDGKGGKRRTNMNLTTATPHNTVLVVCGTITWVELNRFAVGVASAVSNLEALNRAIPNTTHT